MRQRRATKADGRSTTSYEPQVFRARNCMGPLVDGQLDEDTFDMGLDCLGGNPEGARDFLVRLPLGDQLKNVTLPGAKRIPLSTIDLSSFGLVPHTPSLKKLIDVRGKLRGLRRARCAFPNRMQQRADFRPLIEYRLIHPPGRGDVQDFAEKLYRSGAFVGA